jgi:hypothetical protein
VAGDFMPRSLAKSLAAHCTSTSLPDACMHACLLPHAAVHGHHPLHCTYDNTLGSNQHVISGASPGVADIRLSLHSSWCSVGKITAPPLAQSWSPALDPLTLFSSLSVSLSVSVSLSLSLSLSLCVCVCNAATVVGAGMENAESDRIRREEQGVKDS